MLNSKSSRSHCVYQIKVTRKVGDEVTKSCINVVDLAGSESLARIESSDMTPEQAATLR